MHRIMAVACIAGCGAGTPSRSFKPAALPELAAVQHPEQALAPKELLLPANEQLIWEVHLHGMTIGRAEMDIGETEVRSRFKTDSLANMVMSVHHELSTIVDRGAARAGAMSESLDVNGKSKHFETPAGGNVGQTMHTALGVLRAWAKADAAPGYVVVRALGQVYRLDVARPTVEDLQGVKTLHVVGRIRTEAPIDIALWFSDTPQRTPVRIELKDDDTQITAELVQQ
jgi:hypothetical protein